MKKETFYISNGILDAPQKLSVRMCKCIPQPDATNIVPMNDYYYSECPVCKGMIEGSIQSYDN